MFGASHQGPLGSSGGSWRLSFKAILRCCDICANLADLKPFYLLSYVCEGFGPCRCTIYIYIIKFFGGNYSKPQALSPKL